MARASRESWNLLLEELRLMRVNATAMRAEANAWFERIDADIRQIKADISETKRIVDPVALNSIAGICRAKFLAASFVDHERHIFTQERKV